MAENMRHHSSYLVSVPKNGGKSHDKADVGRRKITSMAVHARGSAHVCICVRICARMCVMRAAGVFLDATMKTRGRRERESERGSDRERERRKEGGRAGERERRNENDGKVNLCPVAPSKFYLIFRGSADAYMLGYDNNRCISGSVWSPQGASFVLCTRDASHDHVMIFI